MSTEQAYLDIKAYFEAHVANGGVILCRNEEDDYAVFTNFALAQAWIEEQDCSCSIYSKVLNVPEYGDENNKVH